MNKITKKLFRYFAVVLIFFAITAFIGFLSVFRYFTYEHFESGLKDRASSIRDKLEQFLDTPQASHGQGKGAYLRFVNEIAMADAYIIDSSGNPFTFGKNGIAGSLPTQDAIKLASRVFSDGSYIHEKQETGSGSVIFYVGMPVLEQGMVSLAVIIRDTADIHQESYMLAVSILGACLVLALFVSGCVAIFLSRRFAKPIQQIACTTKQLASGNYKVKTDVHDGTELGDLARQTDLLAKKLEAAREESSKMEQMQKDYISNISHELRTPVTVIRSSLEAVCDGVVSGGKALEYQRQVLDECISLQRLVNDMLELSRLQNHDFPIEKESIDVLMALEDAVRAVRVIAHEKSIHIRYQKGKEGYWMEGDYGRLRQMFIAALENSIKYSPTKSEIEVYTMDGVDGFKISIKDHGYGISEDDLRHIFEKFYRSKKNKEKGSGLGLAIIKEIGDRHHINITLQSTWQSGTEIIFCIPKK